MAISIRESAMNYLARREHSWLELKQKLAARDFDENEIKNALDRLIADGLQSDARFAESFVKARIHGGKGPVKIQGELKQRGVDDALISQYLNSQTDWYAQACKVRCKRFGEVLPSEYPQRMRQARFLQQRGFTHEQINRALKTG